METNRPGSWNSVSSVAQSCPTPCDPMNCSMPGLPVHHQLLEFTQTPVELTVLSQNEAGQTTNDQVQDVCQSWLWCVCMKSPPSVYKSSCPLVVMGWQGESQPLDRSLPPLPIAGIQNKANFPFHEPGLFTGFWGASSHPTLVTVLCHKI